MSKVTVTNQAWVTLTTTDSYALGALVLANSLRRARSNRKKVVMITDTVSKPMRDQLEKVFDEVVNVSVLDSCDIVNLELLERPELGITFTKLHCWKLTQYVKCVFLDADTLVLRNCDELFDREELSAAPDAGWPDCFNSGVFVFKPSIDTFKGLMKHAESHGSFDGGDQGLLNTYFSEWATKDIQKHLPFLYNMCATATYTYIPAYKFYGHNVRIIHFLGTSKPWHVDFDQEGKPVPKVHEEHTVDHLNRWWNIFNSDVKPALQNVGMIGLCAAAESACAAVSAPGTSGAHSGFGNESATGGGVEKNEDNRKSWEEGRPDYLGSASFDNILKKIDSTMNSPDLSPATSCQDLRYTSLPSLNEIQHYINHEEWNNYNDTNYNNNQNDYNPNPNNNDQPQHSLPQQYINTSSSSSHYQCDHHHHHQQQFHNQQHFHHYHHNHHNQRHQQNEFIDNIERWSSNIDLPNYRAFEAPELWQVNQAQWERGFPDYLGVNAFDNIKAKLDSIIQPNQNDQNKPQNIEIAQETKNDTGYNSQISSPDNTPQSENIPAPPPPPIPQIPIPDDNRHSWETGNPDYKGAASFDFILRRIEANVGALPKRPEPSNNHKIPVKMSRKQIEEQRKKEQDEEEQLKKANKKKQKKNRKKSKKTLEIKNESEDKKEVNEEVAVKIEPSLDNVPIPQVSSSSNEIVLKRRVLGRGRARKKNFQRMGPLSLRLPPSKSLLSTSPK